MGELRGRRAEGDAPTARAASSGPLPTDRSIAIAVAAVVGIAAVWTLGLPALGVPVSPWVAELAQGILNASLQTVGCVLLFRGAAVQTGRRRAAWATISFGALAGAVGSWVWSTVLLTTRHHPEQGTVDALYAAALFLTTVGVALMPPSEQRSRRVRTVDTAILMLTALTLVWVTPVHQQVDGRVIAGFPTIGVFEVVTVATILVAVGTVARCRPDRHGEIGLMAGALAASGIGMLLYASAPEGYPTSSRVADVVFALGFALAGAAGLRLRGPARTLRRRGTDRTRHWLALPEIATVTTLVALTLHERVDTTTAVSLTLGAVAVALAIARLLQLRVEQRRLSQSLHDSADLLYREARTDALTGLGNRLGFDEHLRTTLERQARAEPVDRCSVTVMFIDVDHFKRFNDALGHAVGDGLLVEVARRIVSTDEVQAYRVGGDEFVAVATGVDSHGATTLADRLLHRFDEPVVVDDHEMAVTVSIGSASWDRDESVDEPPAAGELVRRADLALYRSKELGRATRTAYDPALAARAERQHRLRQGLQRAAEHDELDVVFEPVVALRGHRLVGAVAALQWRSEYGLVGEDVIGPVAVEGGLVGRPPQRCSTRPGTPWCAPLRRPPMPPARRCGSGCA